MNLTVISETNADSAWRAAARTLAARGSIEESRIGSTRELRPVVIELSDPRDRAVFARPINPAFAIAEVIWILSGSNDAAFLTAWNSRMATFVDEGFDTLHGAYGFRLGSNPRLSKRAVGTLKSSLSSRIDQMKRAAEILENQPVSRQVVLQIWDKDLDLPDPSPRSLDVPCNLVSHLLVRNRRLEWFQVMRSTDLVWGLPYNLIQWTSLQEVIAGWLGLKQGTFTYVTNSLHVYQRHWNELAGWIAAPLRNPVGIPGKLSVRSYPRWQRTISRLVDVALDITEANSTSRVTAAWKRSRGLREGYREWSAVLAAEASRRLGDDATARAIVEHAGAYWATSWLQWANSRAKTRS